MRPTSFCFLFFNLTAILTAWLGSSPASAQTKHPKKPIVILFVGNSYFHGARPPMLNYNAAAITDENFTPDRQGQRRRMYVNEPGPWGGVAGIFKKFTDEAGLNYEVHLEAISGQTLKFHYDSALAIIRQPRWDRVIMHDLSTGPLPGRRGGQPERFREYATRPFTRPTPPRRCISTKPGWGRRSCTRPTGPTPASRSIP
jgi:hypothetical protein